MEEWDITHAFVSWKRHWVGWRFMYDISVHISLLNHITTLTQKKSFEWFVSCKLQQVREQQSQWQLLLEVLAFRFVLLVVLKAYSMMIITGPNFMMIKARVVRLEIRGIRRRACRKEMKVVRGTHQVRVIPWVYFKNPNNHIPSPTGTPMNTCLKYLVPHDPTGLNSIWVSQWSSNVTMPLQWGPRFGKSNTWLNGSSVSGSNRCGVYCTAWGCGSNQTAHYSQSECWDNKWFF